MKSFFDCRCIRMVDLNGSLNAERLKTVKEEIEKFAFCKITRVLINSPLIYTTASCTFTADVTSYSCETSTTL
ncbi:hypothetical protein BpHYR1_036734 [Brachionus plicatilis]|uniref:Uncharacterized protein n=1 Tax=Brachionus plicatilis TaxID=10195 RepID=A0A3M7PGQ1_BRAPC|nr:hypothetical protein BpHYR1_036734 [Brachionus plicatilis]